MGFSAVRPIVSGFQEYLRTAFRWQKGRQRSGYDKMLLLQSYWPLPLDVYILRFPEGSEIPPHTDPVSAGEHHRLNILLKRARKGGRFLCAAPIYESERIKYFRPDACEHSVTKIESGSRYVFSIGWVRIVGRADSVSNTGTPASGGAGAADEYR